MKASLRKPLGVLLLCLGIALYAALAVTLVDLAGDLPVLVQALVYLILGIAWVMPLRPWLIFMETGRWRAPRD